MFILFQKRKRTKDATAAIFKAIRNQASYNYILGMMDLAHEIKAITDAERAALMQYLQESYEERG
jgi:hypothetical protein